MNLFIYLLYVAFVYLRPFETFFEELQEYRPMFVLAGLAFAGGLARTFARGRLNVRPLQAICLVSFLACIALSKITNGWLGGAPVALADFSTSALLFVLTATNVVSVQDLRKTMGLLLIITLVLSVAGVAAYHAGFMADQLVLRQYNGSGDEPPGAAQVTTPAEDTYDVYLWRVRSLGFLNDPNDFAQVIVMAMPFLGLWYRPDKKLRNWIVVGGPAVLFVYVIFLTHSRGAFIGLASLMVFGLRRKLGTTKTMALVGVMLLGLIGSNAAGGRGFSTDEESAGSRILAWSDGLNMLRSRPLFGVGYAAFIEHHERTAHNSFVLCFSELGLVGYFVWLTLLTTALRDTSTVADTEDPAVEPELKGAGEMLRSSVVGFLACAWFLSRTYAPPLFILLALCGNAWSCAHQEAPDNVRPSRWLFATSSALFASLVAVYAIVIVKHSG